MRSSRVAPLVLGACVSLAAQRASAVFGLGEPDVHVRAVDAASREPVASAIAIALERIYWYEFHSTAIRCKRTAAKDLGPRGEADLRPHDTGAAVPPFKASGGRDYSIMAYRAGYCAGNIGGPTALQDGELRLVRSSDPPEARLRHLALVARQAATACPEIGTGWIEPLRAAILAESSRIAATPLEKFLAIRVDEAFDLAPRAHKTLRSVLNGYAVQGNVGGMQQMLDWARADPSMTKMYCPPGERICMMPMPNPDQMPREQPFQIDERDEDGFSALMAAAKAMKPASVRWLLDNGADANVVSGPGGFSALDLVLSRARDDVQENGPEGLEPHLLRMIELLASGRARPTLHPRYREELLDVSSWTIGPRLRKFWGDVREKVIDYPARAPFEVACPIVLPARASLDLRTGAPR